MAGVEDKDNNEVTEDILDINNPDDSFSLLRQWTVPEQKTDPSLYKLRLMSYNILAQEYVAAYPELGSQVQGHQEGGDDV